MLGSFDTQAFSLGVFVSGSTAYAVGVSFAGPSLDGFLQIIDVSDPANPTELGSLDMGNPVIRVFVSGNTAYIVDGSSLQIIDVSGPTNPIWLSRHDIPGGAGDVHVSGSTAYVRSGGGLVIIDVSDPLNPTELGSFDTLGAAFGVFVSGSTVYMADRFGGLIIIDVSSCVCHCPPDRFTGCISGAVKNSGGEPLAGKTVILKRIFPRRPIERKQVVTDGEGCYRLTDLDDGIYRVNVRGCKGGGRKVVFISDGRKANGKNFQCK